MKKKVITALLITMTLTLGGVGTVYAMNNDMSILSGEVVNDANMIKEGFIWIVDKESYTETIEHPEEGHWENGDLISPEEGHWETTVIKPEWDEKKWIIDKEEWTEEIHHDAVTEQKKVVDKPAWTEEKIVTACHNCGAILTSTEEAVKHLEENFLNGCTSYGNRVDIIEHPEEFHFETVIITPEWTETVVHPEEGHWETIHHDAVTEQKWIVDKPAVYEQVWKVDKPAWTETIMHPEEGHWEPVKDEEKPEKPEKPEQKPDEETPETPEQKPDEETPETPEQKPDEETPETPEQKPDEETPETPEQKPDEQTPEKPDNSNADNKQDSTEDTSKDKTDNKVENKTDNKTDSKKEDTNTAPKTGDPTNLAYLATLAGSALVGGVSWKFRKRK